MSEVDQEDPLSASESQVVQVNSAPTISGSPSLSAVQDTNYVFVPTATDQDGDLLTFSIANRPDWATFDSSTGRLEGVPGASDIGRFSDIRISVSDGNASASLDSFDVDVTQIGTFSTTINWAAPTHYSDGSPLSDLSSYRIYYGTAAGEYDNHIVIDNPSITVYVIENLAATTHYFVATAINSAGVESEYSNMITRSPQ